MEKRFSGILLVGCEYSGLLGSTLVAATKMKMEYSPGRTQDKRNYVRQSIRIFRDTLSPPYLQGPVSYRFLLQISCGILHLFIHPGRRE